MLELSVAALTISDVVCLVYCHLAHMRLDVASKRLDIANARIDVLQAVQ